MGECEYKTECTKPTRFWVQSIPTTHNVLVCSAHLAQCCNDLDDKALAVARDPAARTLYSKPRRVETHQGCPDNNYARITVKAWEAQR